MNVIQNGPSHRVAELARAMAPDPFSREKLDFLKLGFQDNQYEELEALRCKDRRHNGHCNCVHVSYCTIHYRDRNIAKFLPGPGPAQTKKAGRGPAQNYVICKK